MQFQFKHENYKAILKRNETIILYFLRGITYFIVIIIGYIIFDIFKNGISVISWNFLTAFPRQGGASGGIYPAIIGTFYLVLITISIALPLGIASAIYLAEYSKKGKFLEIVRIAIITLAGVPSIVFGLFGLGLFVIFFHLGTSILSGSLTLACMILPTIIISSEESIKAVPKEFREASLALGATKWQTIYNNVLPYSLPGMLTGSILGVGRAAGETAPIIFTAVAFFIPKIPKSIFDQVMALPYHLYVLATEHPDIDKVLSMQYGTALVLIILVLGLNILAILLRSYFVKKYKW